MDDARARPGDLDRWRDITPPDVRCRSTPTASSASSRATSELAELDWAGYRARYGDIQRLDRILEAEGDASNRYKVSKQADVLMLFYLLSADELREMLDRLGYRLAPEAIPAHHRLLPGPHLATARRSAPVVHAWVLARADRRAGAGATSCEALDERHRRHPGRHHGGGHPPRAPWAAASTSCSAASPGWRPRDDVLWVNPHWPRSLGPPCSTSPTAARS